jgi:hypothetical protein
MKSRIILETEGREIGIELNNSRTAKKIIGSLPIKSSSNGWGNEIYFSIPVEEPLEDPLEILEVGDVAYWPPGKAFCIFFGKTPASTDNRPQAASPVNIVGRITETKDIETLKGLKTGKEVVLRLP